MVLDADGVMYASSSSGQTRRWKYHVFLSFRGEDTRKNFIDHLYASLQRKGIITFRDEEELERGQVIKQSLLQAIEESLCAIVVLSPNYATSTWCLDELVKILHSKKEFGLKVFPIFYGVDPSIARHQKESFAEAFKNHEERFTQDKRKVQRWRDALEEVANLSGWCSANQHEAELIESVAGEVMSKLRDELPFDSDILVGIESKVAEFDSLVANGLGGVRFIGIWGTGGLGKTTLARAFYERRHKDFEFHCFLHNVREVSEKDGLISLQGKLLSCLNKRSMAVGDCYEGRKLIKNMLCNRKILLVLDDVSDISQLENLAGIQGWFGKGSIIIITTRDKHLLSSHSVSVQYDIKFLSDDESLELFHGYAFKGNQPNEDYLELSKTVIEYARGLPLALKVFGSFLCGRTISEWKDAISKFRKVPPNDILKILKVSFDGLEDHEKTIFLDIACFFNGMAKDHVIEILKNLGLHPRIGIKVLIDKSLVINWKGYLRVHDMLQEMGKYIVFQESPDDAGKRSRILCLEDASHVLEKNKGTEAIQRIVLRLEKSSDVCWNPVAFSKMSNLKLLIISSRSHVPHCQLNLLHGLKCLSNTLKVLKWRAYPLDSLPSRTQLHELVDLKMQHSKLKQLWRGTQLLRRLRYIDLSHSKYLIETPNFDGTPHLQRLILKACTKLVEVHPSLGQHKNLVIVDLKGCKSIKILPRKFEMKCLETFVLSGCSKVRRLPEFGKNMERLSKLDLEETTIAKLPQSLGNLIGLAKLKLRNCKNLVCLPDNFHKLKAIKKIDISGCPKFSRLPENLNENECLEELDVSGTAIKEVPPSLNNLKVLSAGGCNGQAQSTSSWNCFFLQRPSSSLKFMMSPTLSSLSSLGILNLSYCNLHDGSLPHDMSSLSSLIELDLRGNNFVGFPHDFISNLSRLRRVVLNNCPRLQSLPQLPSNLSIIYASDCPSIKHFVCSQQLWEFIESFQSELHNLSEASPQDLGKEEDKSVILTHTSGIIISGSEIPDIFKQPTRILTIPGSEVPPWFCNQVYCCKEEASDVFSTEVSFIINVHGYCRSSECWGIAICLVLENDLASAKLDEFDQVWWTCKFLEDDIRTVCAYDIYLQTKCSHQLCIMYIRCSSFVAINQLRMLFYTMNKGERKSMFKIRKCGWRVVCKEDVQRW